MTEEEHGNCGGWGQLRALGDQDAVTQEMVRALQVACARGDRDAVRWRAHYLVEPLLYRRLAGGEGPEAANLLRRLVEHGE